MADPRQDFFRAIRQLRERAGSPGMRGIAERSRGGVSRQTVNDVLTGRHMPRWHYAKALIEALGGNAEEYHPLWEKAYRARQPPRGVNHPQLRRAREHAPEPEGIPEYQQHRAGIGEVAEVGNAHAADGWHVQQVWPAGGNTVWVLLCRYAIGP